MIQMEKKRAAVIFDILSVIEMKKKVFHPKPKKNKKKNLEFIKLHIYIYAYQA